MNILINVAFLCGLLPLLVGTLAFLGWLFTGYSVFRLLGFYTLIIGFWAIIVGFLIISTYPFFSIQSSRIKKIALILLLSNFPVAFIYIVIVIIIDNMKLYPT